MKRLMLLAALFGFMGSARAADITIYYSPSCPHCHHALEFFSNTLVYEYPELKITAVNVPASDENIEKFRAVIKKCEYTSGGVPVIVVGDKCFQGYGDATADKIRDAVNVDLTDEQIATARENRNAMDADADAFRAAHASRANVISEIEEDAQKKTDNRGWIFWGVLFVLIGATTIILQRKKNGRK